MQAYTDVSGHLTIGYGHMMREWESYQLITEELAEQLLASDLGQAWGGVARLVSVPLTVGQVDALTDFVFNEGETAFATSTMLQLINQGRLDLAVNELPRWVYSGGAVMPGLVARRQAEQSLFCS